eukprot:CAMPEP_0197541630 /NCGR_PEP_ID=MMETSP1318-20131121/67238_1 /TAXON_ID=552666 /ORGANISM="Partenskyella glossopodia, Strain RCC365" /LENGTH=283 /DNA_ID=CAMNT_0043100827 /DNA_START=360 /DNA_END=1211 /DNA_ORIENTATION=+
MTENATCTHHSISHVGGSEAYAYNEKTSIRFSTLSAAAYCKPENIKAWTCNHCQRIDEFEVKLVMNDESLELRGFIGEDQAMGATVVSFRGSEGVRDWIDNFDVKLTSPFPSLPTVEVHAGFWYIWDKFFKAHVVAYLGDRSDPDKPIIITGHSLGGSVAALCAFDLAVNGSYTTQLAGVYTYGEPREGNAAFAKHYAERVGQHWRHTHYRDVVPHIPLQSMGYYHVPREVWYKDEDFSPGSYVMCDGSGEDLKCSNSVTGSSISDHEHYLGVHMGEYGCEDG